MMCARCFRKFPMGKWTVLRIPIGPSGRRTEMADHANTINRQRRIHTWNLVDMVSVEIFSLEDAIHNARRFHGNLGSICVYGTLVTFAPFFLCLFARLHDNMAEHPMIVGIDVATLVLSCTLVYVFDIIFWSSSMCANKLVQRNRLSATLCDYARHTRSIFGEIRSSQQLVLVGGTATTLRVEWTGEPGGRCWANGGGANKHYCVIGSLHIIIHANKFQLRVAATTYLYDI